MPVGTYGTVKAMSPAELADSGAQIVLGNTFHLWLRPGVDVIAAKIREVAGEHAVPIFEAPPLARVLYRNVDIGDEIPATLYVAVAQILTYVFQLKVAKRAGNQPPPKPDVSVAE